MQNQAKNYSLIKILSTTGGLQLACDKIIFEHDPTRLYCDLDLINGLSRAVISYYKRPDGEKYFLKKYGKDGMEGLAYFYYGDILDIPADCLQSERLKIVDSLPEGTRPRIYLYASKDERFFVNLKISDLPVCKLINEICGYRSEEEAKNEGVFEDLHKGSKAETKRKYALAVLEGKGDRILDILAKMRKSCLDENKADCLLNLGSQIKELTKPASKREDYISWDEYFMGVARLSAKRSKDPSTQVGCCIVDGRNRIMSVGYNGFPANCSDDEFPWGKGSDDPCEEKYYYVVHSELNAILNFRGESLAGCRLYVTMFPCNECAKAIIQSGITEVIYQDDAYKDKPTGRAAMRMFNAAGVKYTKYKNGHRLVKIMV